MENDEIYFNILLGHYSFVVIMAVYCYGVFSFICTSVFLNVIFRKRKCRV